MAMSRMAIALAIAAPAPPLAAEPVTAEQAMANYRAMFSPVRPSACPENEDPDTIVVCGRTNKMALPLPIEREPGEMIRHPGEGATQASTAGPCRMCTQPVGVDLEMMVKIVKGIGRLLHGDD